MLNLREFFSLVTSNEYIITLTPLASPDQAFAIDRHSAASKGTFYRSECWRYLWRGE